MRSCPILTSSLRQPDNFWQTELFIHSINFHLDNSFLCTIFMDQHNNVTYPAQLLTAQCDRWGRQEEWWVQVQDIFIGFPFCLRGSDRERTVDREWVKPTSGDRWHDYCPLHYSTLPRPNILHNAENCSPDWILRPENKIIFQKCPWAVLARPRLQENGATLYKG